MVSVIAISCIASASQRPQRCNSRRDGCIYEQSGCGDNHSVTGTDNILSVCCQNKGLFTLRDQQSVS